MKQPFAPSNTPLVDSNGQLNSLWSAFFDSLYQTKQVTPPGSLTPYAGSSAPAGWLVCDGSTVASHR